MVSHLVDEDTGNRTSEEEIMSGSKGPDVSERVQMATAISRPTTAQMVCQGCCACLLFVLQRGSVRGEWGVIVLNKLLKEVLDEI